MADGGWKNEDDKMRMIKCGWNYMTKCGLKNADDEIRITKCGG